MNAFEIHVPKAQLRTMHIISIALPVGAIIFLSVVTGITLMDKELQSGLDIMEYVLILELVTLVPASFFVPRLITNSMVKEQFAGIELEKEIEKESSPKHEGDRPNTKKLLEIYQTGLIIGCALLEGCALFGGMVLLIDQSTWGLAIGGFLALMLFFRIPSEYRVQVRLKQMIETHRFAGRTQH